MLGKYCVIRAASAGVFAGVVKSIAPMGDSAQVVLADSRRLWYWRPRVGKWLTAVAASGLDAASKVGPPADEHMVCGCIEIIPASLEAESSIRSHPDA